MTVSLEALDRESVLSAVERLRLQGVDGILVIAPLKGAGEALVDLPRGLPLVAVEAGPADALPVVAVDQIAGAAARHPPPARARPPDRRAHRRPARLPRGRAADRGLALGARGGRRRGPAGAGRRLEPALGLRARAAAAARRPAQRDLRRQRPDGARRAARAARGGHRDPAAGQRGRLRRHPRGAVLHAAADHRAPGLRRDRPPQPRPDAGDDGRRRRRAAVAGDGHAGADPPLQHRARPRSARTRSRPARRTRASSRRGGRGS